MWALSMLLYLQEYLSKQNVNISMHIIDVAPNEKNELLIFLVICLDFCKNVFFLRFTFLMKPSNCLRYIKTLKNRLFKKL